MQYSVHPPTDFICNHVGQLLPSWSAPVLSVLLVLQLCEFPFLERTVETETAKNQLRQRFIDIGNLVIFKLQGLGYLADMFDPRTGSPMYSSAGQLKLDDVAVVCALLNYPIVANSPCVAIIHPSWGRAVYPSTLVSSAPPAVLEAVISSLLAELRNVPSLQLRI